MIEFTEPQARSRAELQRDRTWYEVVAKTASGTVTRLAFTQRKTKSCLLHNSFANRDLLLALGADEPVSYNITTGWTFGPVRVCFSGRTEYELAQE